MTLPTLLPTERFPDSDTEEETLEVIPDESVPKHPVPKVSSRLRNPTKHPKKGKRWVTQDQMMSIIDQVCAIREHEVLTKQTRDSVTLKRLTARAELAAKRKDLKQKKLQDAKERVKKRTKRGFGNKETAQMATMQPGAGVLDNKNKKIDYRNKKKRRVTFEK